MTSGSLGSAAGRRYRPATRRARSRLGGVEPGECVGDLVPALGDLPRLGDAVVESRREIGQPVAERAGTHVGDDTIEARLAFLRTDDVGAPGVGEDERLDAIPLRIARDRAGYVAGPRHGADAERGDDRQPDEDRAGGHGAECHHAERRHDRPRHRRGEEPVAQLRLLMHHPRQKFEITAVKTCWIVAGLEAS